MTETNPFAVAARPGTIEHLLGSPNIRQRFNQMLGDRAPQFVSSIITVYKGFTQQVEPASVIASAAIAATLDLPIERHLGFAHIVPYAGQAQFQMGYRGYIQLALRSGQYQNMNAKRINAEAFQGYDSIGEPIIDWSKVDETKEAVGYAFSWRLVTGFFKTVYWTKEKVEDHATRYSQAYKKKKTDSPWFTAFDAMALKTVISDGLRRWGILSVQLQKALKFDQAVVKDIDAEPEFESPVLPPKPPVSRRPMEDSAGEADPGQPPSPVRDAGGPGPRKRRKEEQQGGEAPTEPHKLGSAGAIPAPAPTPVPRAEVKPLDPKEPEKPHIILMQLTKGMLEADVTEDEVMNFCVARDIATPAQTLLQHLSALKLRSLCEKWPEVVAEILKTRGTTH